MMRRGTLFPKRHHSFRPGGFIGLLVPTDVGEPWTISVGRVISALGQSSMLTLVIWLCLRSLAFMIAGHLKRVAITEFPARVE